MKGSLGNNLKQNQTRLWRCTGYEQRETDFNPACVNQRAANCHSGETERTSVASQARAQLVALTSNVREISPTAILVRHSRNVYGKTLLPSEDVRALAGQHAAGCYRRRLHSVATTRPNAWTFARGSHKSHKCAILCTHK